MVVSRDVDVGQTVAASMSTPQLFLIANDLSQMQILASVDESDIGRIKQGQDVSFTVSAFADRTFHGTVEQVRLQSATTENVVNYTVVVNVQNEAGQLMPGMTATVRFVTDTAKGVLAVPNSALRFQPTPEMLATMGPDTTQAAGGATGDSARPRPDSAQRAAFMRARAAGGAPGAAGAAGARRGGGARAEMATLWTVQNGRLAPIRARTGLTDGQRTQVSSQRLEAGMQVIIGTNTAVAAGGAAGNPFQQSGGRGGPRGF